MGAYWWAGLDLNQRTSEGAVLQTVCFNHLHTDPYDGESPSPLAAADGIEPPSPGSEPGVIPIDYTAMWSVWLESNQRVPGLQSGALSHLATDAYGGTERYRTSILRFFRPPLRPLKLPFQMAERTGLEPANRVSPATRFPGGPTTIIAPLRMAMGVGLEPTRPAKARRFSGPADYQLSHPTIYAIPA